MTAYIAQIGVFLAALVAIGGPTWDSSKKGIKKLRFIGYVAASIALVSFIASIFITIDGVIRGRPLKGVSRKKIPPCRKNKLFFLYT